MTTAARPRFRPWQRWTLALQAVASLSLIAVWLFVSDQARRAEAAIQREQFAQAADYLRWPLRLAPWNSDYQFLAAQVARGQSRLSDAEAYLNRCIQLDGGPTQRVQIEFLLIRVQSGEIDELAPTLFELIERPERHPQADAILSTLAKAYMHRQRYRPALACLTRWLELTPDNPKALHWRAWNLERLSNKPAALRDFLRALELDPDLVEVRLRVAEMYLEDRQGPEALPHVEYLMARMPNDPRVKARMGMTLFLLGQPDEARELMEAGLAELPDDAALIVAVANLDLQQGRPDEAERRLRQLLAADPADTEALFVLSNTLQQLGRTDEAARVMAECQEKRKKIDRIHDLLKDAADTPTAGAPEYAEIGELFLAIGRDKLGLYWLNQALERNPAHPRAVKALAEYQAKQVTPANPAQVSQQRDGPTRSPVETNPQPKLP